MPTLSYADFDGLPPSSALTRAKAAWLLAIRRHLHRIRQLVANPMLPVAAKITAVVEVIDLGRPIAAAVDLLRRGWTATSPLRTPWALLWAATTTPGQRLISMVLRWAGRLLRSAVLTGSDAAQWGLCQCGNRGKALARKLGFGVEWLDTVGREAAGQQAHRVIEVLRGPQPLSLIQQVAALAAARRLLTHSNGRAGRWLIVTLAVAAFGTRVAQAIAGRTVTAVVVMTAEASQDGEPAAQPPAPVGKPDISRPKPRPGSARNRRRS